MDYPYYEELCRRKHPAAKWWRIGDILYYVGLLPAIPLAVIGITCVYSGFWPWSNFSYFVAMGSAVAAFISGNIFKEYFYVLGRRSGIDTSKY